MAFSATDTLNLASSIAGLVGAGISLSAFLKKRMGRATTAIAPTPQPPTYSPYQPQQMPQLPQQFPISQMAAPTTTPHAPYSYAAPPPPQAPQLVVSRQGVVNHSLILVAAVVGILTILFYTFEYFVVVTLTGREGIPQGSPLFFFNAVLLALNLICTFGSLIAMAIVAARTNARNWLIASTVLLLVGLCSVGYALGFFSVVALVPAFFFGLSAPVAPVAMPTKPKPAAF